MRRTDAPASPAAASPAPAGAVVVVERLLRAAAARGASDLHIDPERDGVRVRVRVDGVLHDLERLTIDELPRVVGRLKALASLLAYRSDLPQEGRVPADRSPTGRELRVATFPAVLGERVAIRLDAPEAEDHPLDALGLSVHVVEELRHAFAQPDGVVLLTGPSGSGKTTTLHACLRDLLARTPGRSVVSVEDPVERVLPGVVHTEVSASAGLDFPRALRSLLRQDPDVLLVGEIRDRETARVALEAGLTGHLVASTVHAGTAVGVFARLLDMGVEPFVLTTVVRGVLAQRLLRRRCERCDGGCNECGGTGFAGRALIAEWVKPGAALREAILARGDGQRLAAAAAADGCGTLADDAARLITGGVTTQEEVRRVLGS